MLINENKYPIRKRLGVMSKFLLRSLTYFKHMNPDFVVNSGVIFAVN